MKRLRVQRRTTALVLTAMACLVSPGAAAADTPPAEEISTETPLGACVEEADSDNVDAWLCVGSRLYEADDSGNLDFVEVVEPSEPTFEPTVPEPTESAEPPDPSGSAPDPDPTPSEEPVDPLPTPEPSPSTPVEPAFYKITGPAQFLTVATDDYDTWCENGSICRRLKSDYVGETKGNAAYGNQSGVVGTFDIILKTNLNGSSARFQAIFDWDSGPTVKFHSVLHNLVRTSNGEIRWSDTVDGSTGNGAFNISTSDRRDTGPLMSAPSQSAKTEFVGRLTGYFDTSQAPEMRFAPLNGNKFTCHGTGKNCLMNN